MPKASAAGSFKRKRRPLGNALRLKPSLRARFADTGERPPCTLLGPVATTPSSDSNVAANSSGL